MNEEGFGIAYPFLYSFLSKYYILIKCKLNTADEIN